MTNTPKMHAFCDDALGDLDATALAEQLRQGQLDHRDVVQAAIDRAAKVNPHLNAIETPDFGRAQAFRPGTGFFAGVPTFIKDNTDVKGLGSTHGSRAVPDRIALTDGAFAKQYLAQGFVCLGKSTLPEFGFNASTEFEHRSPTRNPWHTDYSSGASSGGSAALVAAGVVPIAHANDGGGSIRIPAACCGLVGLKPTRGRLVDSEMTRTLPINIVSEGVVTRSVRDTAHFYAEAERYFRNRTLPPLGHVSTPLERKVRIGLVIDSITGHPTDTDTRQAVERTATLLEGLGHQVEPMALPVTRQFVEDFSRYWGFLAFFMEKFGKRTFGAGYDPEKLEGLSTGLSRTFRKQAYKLPGTLYRLHRMSSHYARTFRHYDLVLSPVLAHTTPLLGHLHPAVSFDDLFERLMKYVSFTPLANASGGPAIALPAGQTAQGLPIGIQFFANHGEERLLLETAFLLEQAQPWPRITDNTPLSP